jgi:hypothetical protein
MTSDVVRREVAHIEVFYSKVFCYTSGMYFPKSAEELHHAYIVEGGMAHDVLAKISRMKISVVDNPDVTVRQSQSFGIDDARELRSRALIKPISGSRQFFIIQTAKMTHEAQNALLKVLEEPTGFSVFFLLVPSADSLLSTLRSRAQTIRRNEHHPMSRVDVKDFLGAEIKERIDMISELLPKSKEEERDIGGILNFLSEMELYISLSPETKSKDLAKGLKALYRAKKYCTDKGASHKILLEQTAFLVPQIK